MLNKLSRHNLKYKSSRPEVFCKKDAPNKFAKFTGKHMHVCLKPATLLKKRLWNSCFPVNFAKFLSTSFFKEYVWWLLLQISHHSSIGDCANYWIKYSAAVTEAIVRRCFEINVFLNILQILQENTCQSFR